MKITDIDKEIKKKIVSDRQKDYGDYQYNFTILADLFTAWGRYLFHCQKPFCSDTLFFSCMEAHTGLP